MHTETIAILLVEDNPGDARLIQEMLSQCDNVVFTLEICDRLSEARALHVDTVFDVILLDLSLPDSHGLDTLLVTYHEAPKTPIVVLTGLDDAALGIQAVQAGAQDYLVKGKVDSELLSRAIRYAIERKQTTLELYQANRQLQTSNCLMTQLIQNVAHELRTPLFKLGGFVRLVLDHAEHEGMLGHEHLQYLQTALRETDKLTQLVETFFLLLNPRDLAAKTEPIDIATMLEEAMDSIRLEAQEKQIDLRIRVADSLPPALVNPTAVRQVLDNLLANALKFTPDNGEVVVEASKRGSDGKVQVSVTDTGIGIPFAEHERIFERFHQVDGSASRTYNGAGLGLALCKEIVESHGEAIWVESAPGEGTTFSFLLPALISIPAGA